QQRKVDVIRREGPRTIADGPFPFFRLPQELRDQVYSYLVTRQGSRRGSVIGAPFILKNRKKRTVAHAARERLNRQRHLIGRCSISARVVATKPILHLEILRTSRRMRNEASDCMYSNNWFAISLSKLPSSVIEAPSGWELSRIKKLQLELQLKDTLRMNSYVDWPTFFSSFPSLRLLRVIPTFHPRYYEWARTELLDWQTTSYVYKAFFRELIAAVPGHVDLKMGCSQEMDVDIELQGRAAVDKKLLFDMFMELG
ncbi:hypothetical protein BKA66DRAFT_367795, partial [Pyrenochaeta sp. MPI-SDFR-AT-0127]